MFKDIAKTIEKAKTETYKYPHLCLDVRDWRAIHELYHETHLINTIADIFSLGFMQGLKAGKKAAKKAKCNIAPITDKKVGPYLHEQIQAGSEHNRSLKTS